MTIAEARQARDEARRIVSAQLDSVSAGVFAARLDAFSDAVRALTLAELAGEQSAKLAEAESWMRVAIVSPTFSGKHMRKIIAELDRLRAIIAGKAG